MGNPPFHSPVPSLLVPNQNGWFTGKLQGTNGNGPRAKRTQALEACLWHSLLHLTQASPTLDPHNAQEFESSGLNGHSGSTISTSLGP